MMDDKTHGDSDRLDLSPLDPRADAARFERLVREVRRVATPELVRRQAGLTPWGQIARWRRPILAASGLLALVSAIVVATVHPSTTAKTTLAEAIGVPNRVAQWMQATDDPSPGDLFGVERSEQ
jgi:hypothetical protein